MKIKFNKKWLWGLVPVVLVVTLVIIKMGGTKPPVVVEKPVSIDGSYKGVYMSFDYPTKFKLEKVNTTDGRVLENWKLTESGEQPTTILVTLFASDRDLGVFEPVQERRGDKNQFVEEVGRMRQQRGVLFRTIDKKERAVFFSNNRRILIVDYIAKTNDPEKEKEYQSFLDGIIWE